MPVYSGKPCFSASTNGRGIAVAATSTPGTTIHQVGANGFEEIFMWAVNRTNAPVTLTVEWGDVTNADHTSEAYSLPANSPLIPVVPGLRLSGGLTIKAFCSTTLAINIFGYPDAVV